jgi:hypothetical protein
MYAHVLHIYIYTYIHTAAGQKRHLKAEDIFQRIPALVANSMRISVHTPQCAGERLCFVVLNPKSQCRIMIAELHCAACESS